MIKIPIDGRRLQSIYFLILALLYKNKDQIIDISLGWAAEQQVIRRLQKAIGIMAA